MKENNEEKMIILPNGEQISTEDYLEKIVRDPGIINKDGMEYLNAKETINKVKERSQIQEVKKFEKEYKEQLFSKISEIYSKQFETIDIMRKNANDLGQANIDIPNTGVLANNKVIELSQVFEESGISMFSSKSEKHNFVTSSFLGDAIIQDLTDKISQSTEKMNEYAKKMEEVSEERNKRIQALQNISPSRKFFLKIRSLFVPAKPIDLSLTDEEQGILDSSLQEYKDIADEICNYNLQDSLVPALVKEIAGPQKFGEFSIEHRYNAQGVSSLLDECVITDLKKLGLESLIPQLQESLIEEYKKDIPDYVDQKTADEFMHLYVPDFSNKTDEKHHITKKETPESQKKKLNTNTLNDELQELSSETAISDFNDMSQNLKNVQNLTKQEQTMEDNVCKKEDKGWEIDDN